MSLAPHSATDSINTIFMMVLAYYHPLDQVKEKTLQKKAEKIEKTNRQEPPELTASYTI